jgi:L-amino acid N-acyltransferase YncA
MIRNVESRDVPAITDIYNEYVKDSVITFETEPLTVEKMRERIADISEHFPYFVYETDGHIDGYCYVHQWKERAAYRYTVETTIYLSSTCQHKGIGTQLLTHLIETCRQRGYHALIACITEGNEASYALHRKLGFKQVSHFEKVGMKFGRKLDVADFELLLEP